MKYCPTSTVVRNPASVQNLLNLSCCDSFSSRSLFLRNRTSSCAGSSVKSMFVFITFGTNNGLDCPSTTGPPCSIMARFTFFTHFCDCSVKTELIHRNNCAKNSFNRSWVGTIVYRQFSTTFALMHHSGQWTRGSEDWVCAFCKCQHHLLCNSIPFYLWTVFTNRVPFLF